MHAMLLYNIIYCVNVIIHKFPFNFKLYMKIKIYI